MVLLEGGGAFWRFYGTLLVNRSGKNIRISGYFPFLFYTTENQYYVGPHPPAETYGLDKMKGKQADEFLTWHKDQTGTFNMQEQVKTYCEMDVSILRASVSLPSSSPPSSSS